jgi:Spy/CpxP family protein refolding chaperone
MNKITWTQLLLAAGMALPLAAGAGENRPPEGGKPGFGASRGDHRGMRHGGHPGHAGLSFLRGLELSESQEDRLFQLMHSQAPYMHEQQKAHEKAMRGLHEMRSADKFDDAAAAKLAQTAAQSQANMTLARIRTHQKVLALLTPEQRKKLDERKERTPRGGVQ